MSSSDTNLNNNNTVTIAEEGRASMTRAKSIEINHGTQGGSSEVINIDSLPAELQSIFQVYDVDGDGVITTSELMEAANARKTLKMQIGLFRKGTILMSLLSLVLVLVNGGLTYGIIDASKDTVVEGRALFNKKEEPVGININQVTISLGSLAFMPKDVPSKINEILFQGPNEEIYYHRVNSIVIKPKQSVVLKTSDGAVIVWEKEEDERIQITLADDTTWNRDSECEECTATSVVANDAIFDALEEYHQVVNRRLQLGGGPRGSSGC